MPLNTLAVKKLNNIDMPFKSDKQKRWMYANKPEMAKEWSAKEDNESYEHKTDALVAAGGTKSEDIDKIDLSKWKEYPAEDVMKAVYRQYGKELPSVDSYDWAISWDKKVRPWLKKKFNESYINKDMDNEFDKQASQILTENVDGLRWSEEYDIDEAPDITADLTSAEIGATYLFDDIDLLFPEAGTEQGVMDRLSDHGAWELKDNPYGAIVVKVGDILDDQPDYELEREW
jgi:hypothetical protein